MAAFNGNNHCPYCNLEFSTVVEFRDHCIQKHMHQIEAYRREINRDKMLKIMPCGMKDEWESKWEKYVTNGRNKFNCSNCKKETEIPKYGWDHQFKCKCDNHKYCSRHCQKIHWKKIHRYQCDKNRNLEIFNYDQEFGDCECEEFLKIIMIIKEFAEFDKI